MLLGAFASSAAFADTQKVININEVQGWIAQKHANWRAKETWVSRLSKDELKRMFGLQRAPQGRLDYEGMRIAGAGDTAIDWRSVNGVNWLGPVMNQGNCGSCVAFATVATLEAQTSISSGLPWLHPSYSPQALFACGGGGCDTGWMPDEAASFLQSSGVPDEACMPYTSGSTGIDASCNSMCSDSAQRNTKIAGFTTPSGGWTGSVDQVKTALKNGPLVTTLSVYADFVTYGSGVYKHVVGDVVGGHAVSLVGYDDTKRAWLIRNSWGAEWGENGFAWISWDDDSGVGSETWGFEMPQSQDFLAVTSPSDSEYVSGQYQLTSKVQGLKGQAIEFHVTDSSGRDVTRITCSARTDGTCSAQMDSTQLKEGRYQIFAEVASNGGIRSQVREFYVINSEPKMSLSFTPVDGVDLSAPINGRPEFNVTAKSSPVPMQHVEFRAIDQSGKIVSIKGNDYVLEQMRMGWRTVTVPDGQYTILFHGQITYKGKVYAVDSNSFTITVKN